MNSRACESLCQIGKDLSPSHFFLAPEHPILTLLTSLRTNIPAFLTMRYDYTATTPAAVTCHNQIFFLDLPPFHVFFPLFSTVKYSLTTNGKLFNPNIIHCPQSQLLVMSSLILSWYEIFCSMVEAVLILGYASALYTL